MPTALAMVPSRLALPLSACLLLTGCTFFGGDESTPGPDKTGYSGGPGFGLAILNAANDPFDVTLRVLGAGNTELALIEETLDPGESVEKWWSLQARSTYSARLNYVWNGAAGSTAHGFDEQTFDANECPAVSRLSWELKQDETNVGSAFLGKTCVLDEE